MVTKLKYGNTNTFFVRGLSGNLLIDTDYAGTLPAFYRAIKEHNIKVSMYILQTRYSVGINDSVTNPSIQIMPL